METQKVIRTISWIPKLVSAYKRVTLIVIFFAAVLLSVKIISFWDGFQDSFRVTSFVSVTETFQKKKESEVKTPKIIGKKILRFDDQKSFDPSNLTVTEVKVLQKLAQRRDQIQLREKELNSKETVLSAVEARLDSKLNELKGIKAKIEAAIRDNEKTVAVGK